MLHRHIVNSNKWLMHKTCACMQPCMQDTWRHGTAADESHEPQPAWKSPHEIRRSIFLPSVLSRCWRVPYILSSSPWQHPSIAICGRLLASAHIWYGIYIHAWELGEDQTVNFRLPPVDDAAIFRLERGGCLLTRRRKMMLRIDSYCIMDSECGSDI